MGRDKVSVAVSGDGVIAARIIHTVVVVYHINVLRRDFAFCLKRSCRVEFRREFVDYVHYFVLLDIAFAIDLVRTGVAFFFRAVLVGVLVVFCAFRTLRILRRDRNRDSTS